MSDQVWGTGYGSKRHLPEGEIKTVGHPLHPRRTASAACSPTSIFLDTFSDTHDDIVMAKTPCTRCAKKGALVVCTACGGAGVVAQ